jgi:RNA polymerase sigma-70 factor, ECF subfamily
MAAATDLNVCRRAGSILSEAARRAARHRGVTVQVDLVERAGRGDRDAFATLVRDNVDRCYGLAYRILRDHHRAQDATQQALLGAWRDLPNLREASRFDAWLHRLVVHACYAEARTERRWVARVRAIQAPDSAADHAPEVVERDSLERSFRKLTPEQRAVVVLHHHFGYPLTEIASLLGIPEGTARSRLHYAVRILRAQLDAEARHPLASEERSA